MKPIFRVSVQYNRILETRPNKDSGLVKESSQFPKVIGSKERYIAMLSSIPYYLMVSWGSTIFNTYSLVFTFNFKKTQQLQNMSSQFKSICHLIKYTIAVVTVLRLKEFDYHKIV